MKQIYICICIREVLFYQFKWGLNNIRFDIWRIRWIIPYYFALSLFVVTFIIITLCWYVTSFLFKSTFNDELENIVPSRSIASYQILIIGLMSVTRQTKIIAQIPFKERFRKNNRDFNHNQYIKRTELSKYIWSLRDARTPYTINWSIIAKAKCSAKIYYRPQGLTGKDHL